MSTLPPIPILRPRLPTAERLAPYLKAIDDARYYSNFGPQVLTFETRLAEHYGLKAGAVASVANATLGLALTLAAAGARQGTLCLMPAWTFVACAQAAVSAGLTPYFVDVDPETWALDAATVEEAVARAPEPVGAVMPVAPFGQPIDVSTWDAFRERTGIPVVIDAAAGLDALTPGPTPTVVSLHATKVLGIGEGGFMISTNPALAAAVRSRSNFGFVRSREAKLSGTNAKLSEIQAAVGHAALDEWTEVRSEWMTAARTYRDAFAGTNRIAFQPGFGKSWVSSTCVVRVADGGAAGVEAALAAAGIDTRRWWGNGAHRHTATASFPRAELPVTEMLACSTIALPFSRDSSEAETRRVTDAFLSISG
jgi:dTDP-4-amino-4,6-dideoxygalactose transaminase